MAKNPISTNVQQAARHILAGDVIGVPTETVYGLGASIYNAEAIDNIFTLKERPRTNPLIVHISTLDQLNKLVTAIPKNAIKLAKAFWPGSLTLLLPKNETVSDYITAGKPLVAVRIPNHPLFLELLNITGPIAAPSANPFERISPTSAIHVANYFGEKLSFILDGGSCKSGIESTIVGFENNKVIVYRLGAISIEQLEEVVGEVNVNNYHQDTIVSPGMAKKHYSPITKTIVTKEIEKQIIQYQNQRIGIITFQKEIAYAGFSKQLILSKKGDLAEAAKNIYAYLHELDQHHLDVILIEPLPNIGLGRSINDRLFRANHE